MTDEKTTKETDTYGREQCEKALITLLEEHSFNEALMLDGFWGTGKTCMIKRLCKRIESTNTLQCLYFDAFRYEPLNNARLSLIGALFTHFSKNKNKKYLNEFVNKCKPILRQTLKVIVSELIPCSAKELIEAIEDFSKRNTNSKDLIEEIISQHASYTENEDIFKGFLLASIPKDQKLVLFIDELDRCKPDYTLSVLEAAKHLLVSEKLIVVFSADKGAIHNAISHYYGNNIDPGRYLKKFISLTIRIPERIVSETSLKNTPAVQKHLSKILKESKSIKRFISTNEKQIDDLSDWVINLTKNHVSLSLRDIEQMGRLFSICSKDKYASQYPFSIGCSEFIVCVLFFVIIILRDYCHFDKDEILNAIYEDEDLIRRVSYDDLKKCISSLFDDISRSPLDLVHHE